MTTRLFRILYVIVLSTPLISLSQTITPGADSVHISTSIKYSDPSFFKKIILGKNYRQEWETPVTLPVFYIKNFDFKILELGGGQQTKSLRMEDKRGREWVLRTIDKDVQKALPLFLRNTLAKKVVQDMVSAAHPYSPLIIPPLAKVMGIIVPEPTFYYVPDDPAFGEHKDVFAHQVVMLEQREPTPDNSDTKSTASVVEKLFEENDHLVIQQAVLKARLLDMLIADWDRHADQWRWGKFETGGMDYYYAIPRDRDQAFFQSKGLLVKIARLIALRHMVGFRDDMKKMKQLNFKSWQFDRIFLNQLDRNKWDSTIKLSQAQLTDEVIENAVKKLPPEIYAINGQNLTSKLKSRRNDMHRGIMDYYEFLAVDPEITGTDDAEIFRIKSEGNLLTITVFDKKDGVEGRRFYKRSFDPDDTKIITVSGLGGKDVFIVEEGTSSTIRLKFYGGEGDDTYDIKGNIRNKIYDSKEEDNQVINKKRSRIKIK
ncbi:MAG: hypothetical protein M3413_09045 [Bacteroidota bacterium]|nr:hypothetical protein [Bacteroidota bacterium]